MVSAGIAGIASNTWAGWLIDRFSVDLLYLICGIGALMLGSLGWWILSGVQRPAAEIRAVPIPSDTIA
jgi:hypothetical protein